MNPRVLAALIFATAGAPLPGIASPQTCVWTGQGGNALWSTDGNWTCLAVSPHGHPQNGDDVGFPDSSQQPVNTNDLSQLVIHHLILDRHALAVTGNPISLTGGLSGNPPGGFGPRFSLGIKLAADGQTFQNTSSVQTTMILDGSLDLNNHNLTIDNSADLYVGGISGSGNINKSGSGALVLFDSTTYTGQTDIIAGAVLDQGGDGLGAPGAGNETFVDDGSTLILLATGKSIAESLSLSGGGVTPSSGALRVGGDGNVITSSIVLVGSLATISIPDAHDTLTIAASFSGFGTLKKIGNGTLRVDAIAPDFEVDAGVLELNGADDGTFVGGGAALAGIGTAFGTTSLNNGSFASPGARSGNDIGTLTMQDLNWFAGAQMRFQLGRSAALSDRMIVSANLAHNGSGTYAFAFSDASTPPVPGVTYTLITFASNQGFAESDFSFTYAGIPAPGQGSGMIGAFKLTSTQLQFTPSAVASDLLFRDGFD